MIKIRSSLSKLLTLFILAFIVFGCSENSPQPIQFNNSVYFFDVGSSKSELYADRNPLTPSFKYSSENGYGWLTDSLKPFEHTGWDRSRDAFLVDGVLADKIEFKADVPEGTWWITFWFEAGMEDSSTTQIFINGLEATPQLQAFTPGSEVREDIQKIYRVVQKKVVVKEDGLTFSLVGGDDVVRLLGFAFIPDPQLRDDKKTVSILEKIKNAGTYNSAIELQPLINELNELKGEKQYQNFAFYWKLQLELLQEAEKYFNYRGWSWASDETGLGLFDHLHQSVMLYDGLLAHEDSEDHALYERGLWYRGRLLYWLWLERGIHFERDAAKRDLAKMYQLHPNDDLIRMYNGEKLDEADPFDEVQQPSNAPDWAFAQWEVMNRLKYIADYWVLERQSETGEFGGKFGDDVEILRFWSPLILSGDSVVYRGWKKLADGVWNSSKIHNGYAKNPSDVEHSSEFISDTAPLMVLYSDDPIYKERLAWSADHFQNLWTGYNVNGNRFFKSSWFSSTEVEMTPPKNRDVPYTTRATKAVRYYSWKSNDSLAIEALTEWADAWLIVSQRTDKGKPMGLIPASVEFPSESFNGDEPNWHTANMFWDYFDWSGGTAILDQFLFTWTLTGNAKYLEPINQHLELVYKYRAKLSKSRTSFDEGSEEWAAHILGNSSNFWNLIGTWRLLTGDSTYDNLIIEHGTPFIKYRLTGNEDFLVQGIQPYLETIRYNYPMLTSEVIATDRVHIAPGNQREAGILQGMVTGYGIAESASPYIAVSWEKATRDLTFLVTDSDSSSVRMKLYSFSNKEEETTMRIWQLKPDDYSIEILLEGKTVYTKTISVQKRGERVDVSVPAKKLVEVIITSNQSSQ